MDIRQATEQIEGAIRAYLACDESGLPLIPFEMQRPLILMGPPGIGKTAIVSQVAERLGIGFVSYSITHHTRQSALGLPYIAEAEYGGQTYRVSRYTMSEIIGAVHDEIANGSERGILFLDEVNCASETLMPSMLQFLQYKTFGTHRLPVGWVIVCAGNPPEYNRAARDFDPAMMDRLKRIDIEASHGAWQDYAVSHGVHPAVITYLANKPKNFYKVRAAASGSRIVTARGWEDLSRMLLAYEREDIPVDLTLVSQYLQDHEVAEDFSLYYELFAKYQDDYKVADILAGTSDEAILARASHAPFDERVAVVNLLSDAVLGEARTAMAREEALGLVRDEMLGLRELLALGGKALTAVDEVASGAKATLDEAVARGNVSPSRQRVMAEHARILEQVRLGVARWQVSGGEGDAFEAAKAPFNEAVVAADAATRETSAHLDNALAFLDAAFGEGQEEVVFVSRLSVDTDLMRFVAAHGSESFAEHARQLMFHERGLDLLDQVDKLRG